MKLSLWSRAMLPLLVGVLAVPGPAMAQFTKSFKFLEAVRDKDGQEVIDDLSEPGSTLVNTHDTATGETALHIVTGRRDLEWMNFLISKGADVNVRDIRGQTPLVVAANMGFIEGVDLLVEHDAHVDEPSATGETPLIAAVHRRDLAMMRVLLVGGADPDRADNTGRTARDYAASAGKSNSMVSLIDDLAKSSGAHAARTYGPTL